MDISCDMDYFIAPTTRQKGRYLPHMALRIIDIAVVDRKKLSHSVNPGGLIHFLDFLQGGLFERVLRCFLVGG